MTESIEDQERRQPPHAAQGHRRRRRPRRRLRRHHRLSLCPLGRAEGAALSRHRGERGRRHLQEVPGRHRHQDRIHHRDHRRRHQARHHPAELVRRARHRIFLAEEAGAVGQHPCARRQEDQGIRQDHAGLHQGRVARRQEDRRPGHGALEGALSRRRELQDLLDDADRIRDADPDRLQCRHARHPARPDQAPDQLVGRTAQPRIQGQGLDPQHSRRSASWMPRWSSKPPASTNTTTRAT